MPSNAYYVTCPFCFEKKRIDKIVTHLLSHKCDIIEYMTVEQREHITKIQKPIMYIRRPSTRRDKPGGLYLAICLHCKKGGASCSNRNKMEATFETPHTECVAQFPKYASLFAGTEEPKSRLIVTWKEVAAAEYREIRADDKVSRLSKEGADEGSAIPKETADIVSALWAQINTDRIAGEKAEAAADGMPYEPDEEAEPDLLGKLTELLSDYKLKKRLLANAQKTIVGLRDEIAVLEHDIQLKEEAIQRTKL
jgi:hypothetical protein